MYFRNYGPRKTKLNKSLKSPVLEDLSTSNIVNRTWFYTFLRQHPQIKMSRVEKFCEGKSIRSSDQIYNCNESGFPLQTATSLKVCVDKHCRRNFQIASKVSITTLQCICANSNVVPPAVLFPVVNFTPEFLFGIYKEWLD